MKRRNTIVTAFLASVLAIGIACIAPGGFAETTNVPAVAAQPATAQPVQQLVEPAQPILSNSVLAKPAQPTSTQPMPAPNPVPAQPMPAPNPVPAQPMPAPNPVPAQPIPEPPLN